MKVLTLKFNGETHDIHMLNPGEVFPNFGGSRGGLVVGSTASLVLSRHSQMGIHDTEIPIHDRSFWTWIARLINENAAAAGVVAETPEKEEP